MLALPASAKVFLCQDPTDLRKGFESLGALVEQVFGQDLTCDAYFAFLNRKRDRMKLLYWDGDGLAIWYKRLEKGSFPKSCQTKVLMQRKDFFMLLEGIIPKKVQKRLK